MSEDEQKRGFSSDPHHHYPPPPPEYGTFQGVANYPPPPPPHHPPPTGFPQPVPPPGAGGPSAPHPDYYTHGYQTVPGYAVAEGRPVRERRLPCCGCGLGWCLFIIGFFLATVPWYVGAFILLCARIDPREKPGYIACTLGAILATIAIVLGATREVMTGNPTGRSFIACMIDMLYVSPNSGKPVHGYQSAYELSHTV